MLAEISAHSAENAAIVQGLLRSATGERMEIDNAFSSTLSTPLNLERHDLSQLVATCYKNQSRESAESVRTKERKENTDDTSARKPPTERQLLATRIYDALRLDTELGSSTGLNRRTRHTTIGESTPIITGNAANAQATALTGAAVVSSNSYDSRKRQTYSVTIDRRTAKEGICWHCPGN